MDTGQSPVPQIFVSHSSKDNVFCYKLVRDLRRVLKDESAVWFDTLGGLAGGDKWWHKITEELMARDIFIVIVSSESMASPWVNDEITLAWVQKNSKSKRRIIPILYTLCEIRDDIANLHSISFLPPRTYNSAFKELLKFILTQSVAKKLSRRSIVGRVVGGLVLGTGGLAFALTQLNRYSASTNMATNNTILAIHDAPAQIPGPWFPWSPDSRYLATQGDPVNTTLNVWDIQQKKQISSFYGHKETTVLILDTAWSPNGKALASIDVEGTMQISNPSTGRLVQTYKCFSTIMSDAHIFWSHNAFRVVATAPNSNDVYIWSADSQEYVLSTGNTITDLNAVYWSPRGTHLALKDQEFPISRVWDATIENKTLVYHNSYQASLVAWSPDLQYLASFIDDESNEIEKYTVVQVWNASTAKLLLTYTGHTDSVRTIAWSPDGKSIISGSNDKTVQIWNAHTGILVSIYRGHVESIDAVSWSPDGKYIASSSNDMRVWQAGRKS